ncbi:hypothetical protein Fmac_020176 [Flemingia macrophylla]|uniref:Defensin-like protein n=1 Tax=Flemingia macrophylla TaxID=520843 RepID=A0ABD1LT99_9FABA
MKTYSSVLFALLILSIVLENGGPLRVTEAKICEKKLYDYCDENCYDDCPKKYGKTAIGICIYPNNDDECICIYRC